MKSRPQFRRFDAQTGISHEDPIPKTFRQDLLPDPPSKRALLVETRRDLGSRWSGVGGAAIKAHCERLRGENAEHDSGMEKLKRATQPKLRSPLSTATTLGPVRPPRCICLAADWGAPIQPTASSNAPQRTRPREVTKYVPQSSCHRQPTKLEKNHDPTSSPRSDGGLLSSGAPVHRLGVVGVKFMTAAA